MEKTPDTGRGLGRRLLRAGLIGLASLAILAGLGITWLLLDTGRSKGIVEYVLTEVSGREFRIDGDFSLGLGEELRIAASEVRWANMEGGEAPYLLDVGRILVTIPLASLFDDNIVIRYAEAENARIWLEWNADGLLNWVFFPDNPPSAEPLQPLPLLLQQASLRDTELRVIAPALTEELVLTVVRAEHAEDARHRLVLDADLLLDDRPLVLSGPIGPFPELAVAGAVDFDLALTGELAQLTALGSFESLLELSGPDLQAEFSASDADAVLERLRLPRIAAGSIDLRVNVATDAGGVVASAQGNLGNFLLDSKLTVQDLTTLAGFELVAESSGPSVSDLLSLASIEGLSDLPYQLSVAARDSGTGLVLEKFLFETAVTSIRASGSASQVPDLRDLKLDLNARGGNISSLLSLFAIDINYPAPFEIDMDIDSDGPGSDDQLAGSIVIGDSRIEFDGKLTEAQELDGSELHATLVSPDIGPVLAGLGVVLGGEVPLDIDTRLALADQRVLIREATGRFANARFTSSGSVPVAAGGRPAEVGVQIAGPDLKFALNRLAPGAGDMLPAQPFTFASDTTLANDVLTLKNARATTGSTVAVFAGDIGIGGDAPGIRGNASLQGDNLAELMASAGIAGFAPAPFSVSSDISADGREIVISNLDAKLPNGSIRGTVTAFGKGYGDLRFDVRASGDNLDLALPEIDAWTPENVAFDLALRGLIAEHAIDIESADIRLGEARVRAATKVLLEPDFKLESLALNGSGPRLADLGRIGNWDLRNRPFEIRAQAKRAGNRSELRDFLFRAGSNDLRGTLILEEGATDFVSLQLQSENLDLDDIRTKIEDAEDAAAQPTESGKSAKARSVFNDDPLPFELLREINGDAAVDIANLVADGRVFNDVVLRATLQDGNLVVERGKFDTSNGTLTVSGTVAPAGDKWEIYTDIDAQGLSIELDDMTPAEIALLPRYAVDSQIRMTGRTSRELAQTATGYFWALGGQGQIRRLQMTMLTGDFLTELFNKLNPLAKQSDYSTLICHNYFFEIDNGVVSTAPALVIQSNIVTIVARGTVNLETEKLNVDFETTPNKGIGISVNDFVNPFIKVTGTLAEPRITLDPQGSAVRGGAAVMTGGLSIFAEGLWKRWVTSGEACQKVAEQADKLRREREPDNVPDLAAMRAGI